MSEEYEYKRKDGTKAIFKTKADYDTFMRALKDNNVDIDKEIDIWINYIDKRLKDRGLDEIEIKLFFERFKLAV